MDQVIMSQMENLYYILSGQRRIDYLIANAISEYDKQCSQKGVDQFSSFYITDLTISPTFPRGWKALQFSLTERPKGMSEWFNALWGWDIWYYNFPLLKTLILCNVLVWLLFVI